MSAPRQRIDWAALHAAGKIDWSGKTSVEIGAQFGVPKQTVEAARKRLGAPPSPAGHGGTRAGSSSDPQLRQLIRRWAKLSPQQRATVLQSAGL